MKHTGKKVILILIVFILSLYVALPSTIPVNINLGPIRLTESISKTVLDRPLLLGLDLVGGARLVFEADTSGLASDKKEQALESLKTVVEKRVNLFGLSESQVTRSKYNDIERVVVELPGVEDITQAIAVVGRTAQLVFAEVKDETTLTPTDLTGADLVKAEVAFDQISSSPVVSIEFSEAGSKKFAEITERNVGKPLAILLDGQVVSAPQVNEAIIGGRAQISGSFTTEVARELAVQLTAGSLPVPIKLVEERRIGASLGTDAVEKSIKAGVVGVILVVVFMVLLYKRLGLIAAIGLLIFATITISLYKLIPVVLTLPGIAGFLLSIGMAVDSNILVFERFKEERKKGGLILPAFETAFGRAWDSIRDANIATLTTAFILANPLDWQFLNTSGPVRGFAITLALGIAVSLFTGIFVTRNLLRFFIRK